MKVCLTTRENETWPASTFMDVMSFSRGVDDSEATEPMCDYFLSSHYHMDLPKLISLILGKVRIGGEVIFIDYDWPTISRFIEKDIPLEEINASLQKHTFKSVLSMEEVLQYIPNYIQ